MTLEELLVGKKAKANHPITTLNPEPVFEIFEVKAEYRENIGHVILIRGENTCWFGRNAWELVNDCK